jgi:hypothetical protein
MNNTKDLSIYNGKMFIYYPDYNNVYEITSYDNNRLRIGIRKYPSTQVQWYDYQLVLVNEYIEWIDENEYIKSKKIVETKFKTYKDSIYGREYLTSYVKSIKKCTCGSRSIGINDYQVGHSDWCDVYHGKKI